MHNRPWFKRRRSGLGYTPVTWEGWLISLAFVAVLVVTAQIAKGLGKDAETGRNGALVLAAVEIMGFMVLVRRKTEKPSKTNSSSNQP